MASWEKVSLCPDILSKILLWAGTLSIRSSSHHFMIPCSHTTSPLPFHSNDHGLRWGNVLVTWGGVCVSVCLAPGMWGHEDKHHVHLVYFCISSTIAGTRARVKYKCVKWMMGGNNWIFAVGHPRIEFQYHHQLWVTFTLQASISSSVKWT